VSEKQDTHIFVADPPAGALKQEKAVFGRGNINPPRRAHEQFPSLNYTDIRNLESKLLDKALPPAYSPEGLAGVIAADRSSYGWRKTC
jgi:hypothetical protein